MSKFWETVGTIGGGIALAVAMHLILPPVIQRGLVLGFLLYLAIIGLRACLAVSRGESIRFW